MTCGSPACGRAGDDGPRRSSPRPFRRSPGPCRRRGQYPLV